MMSKLFLLYLPIYGLFRTIYKLKSEAPKVFFTFYLKSYKQPSLNSLHRSMISADSRFTLNGAYVKLANGSFNKQFLQGAEFVTPFIKLTSTVLESTVFCYWCNSCLKFPYRTNSLPPASWKFCFDNFRSRIFIKIFFFLFNFEARFGGSTHCSISMIENGWRIWEFLQINLFTFVIDRGHIWNL